MNRLLKTATVVLSIIVPRISASMEYSWDNGAFSVETVSDEDPVAYRNTGRKSFWTIFKGMTACQDTSAALRARHRLTPAQGKILMEYLSSKYSDRESWELRKAEIRADLKRNMGLAEVSQKFNGRIFLGTARNYDGYSVMNMGLEILPGVFCTGSVYWPEVHAGLLPLILNPHGHYEGGRNHPIVQTRCAALALMGCVSVSYDMFAYGSEPQFDEKFHKTAVAQPFNVLCAERLLDLFLADSRIDNSRVGITGSSGGGSQCFFVTALDDRITLSIPVVMVSSASFGGCPCESGTEVHFSGTLTNNVELAALCAPRPMLLISDGADWTKDFPEIDFPYIERVYGFYAAENKVDCVHFPDEVHDYGPSKRKAAYEFLAKHWNLNTDPVIASDGTPDESRCMIESAAQLKVWGHDCNDLPSDAVRSVREFADMLGWQKKK